MPTTRRRRWFLRAVLVGSAVVAGWLLWLLYRAPGRTDLATYWQLVVAVAAMFVALVPLWRGRRDPGRDLGPGEELARVQDQLAEAVRAEGERAAKEQGLLRPASMAVHWSFAASLTPPGAEDGRSAALADVPGYERVDGRRLRRAATCVSCTRSSAD